MWFSHFINELTGYDLVSGWIPCIIAFFTSGAILTTMRSWVQHHRCEYQGCKKWGHPHPEHARPVCRQHFHEPSVAPPKRSAS